MILSSTCSGVPLALANKALQQTSNSVVRLALDAIWRRTAVVELGPVGAVAGR